MAENKKVIMAWSECKISIGTPGDQDAMATSLSDIGFIKDKSTTLEASDGEELKAVASGGKTIAREKKEGDYMIKTRVIEPSNTLLKTLGLGEEGTEPTSGTDKDFKVKTHIVQGSFSVQIDPKNVGAKGIKAPLTNISVKPGWSEDEGNYLDVEFSILHGAQDFWYIKFVKQAS